MTEGKAEGIAVGKAEGKTEGKTEGKAEVIRNLLSLGKFSAVEIAKLANVSEDFVKKIEASQSKEK